MNGSKIKCTECDEMGVYRYAPHDGENNWPEEKRWRCEEHKPYNATCEGWNGEWDYCGKYEAEY